LNQNLKNLKLSLISSQAYSEEQECHELNLCLSFQHIIHFLQKLKNIMSLNYVKYLNSNKQEQYYEVFK